MAKLLKPKLVEIFVDTIQNEGGIVEARTPRGTHPAVLHIRAQGLDNTFRLYIWNLSRGGNNRPVDEYRIQISGLNEFEQQPGETTLILGYWAELELFVAFDYAKHTSRLGASVSFQIREKALHDAVIEGIAIYPKDNEEKVVVFGKESALTYLRNYEAIHAGRYNFDSADKKEYIDLLEDEPNARRHSLTTYGADYSVRVVVQQIKSSAIYVPNFQRQFIWSREEGSRFIESLILGLPVPGIFLAYDSAGKLIIIDGQQRLMSLYYFYNGILRGEKFSLRGVAPDLEGKTYENLSYEDKARLDNQVIHATVVSPDDPKNDTESVYVLFERLNSGGKKLTAQEIRSSLYYGAFNEYLNEVVTTDIWAEIFGFSNDRFKSQELILRFLAFYYERSTYETPMSLFLNKFMSENREFGKYTQAAIHGLLFPALANVRNALGRRAFRVGGGINAAVFDSVMIGLVTRLKSDNLNSGEIREAYNSLLMDDKYLSAVRAGTAHKASIEARIQIAIDYFGRDYYSATLL